MASTYTSHGSDARLARTLRRIESILANIVCTSIDRIRGYVERSGHEPVKYAGTSSYGGVAREAVSVDQHAGVGGANSSMRPVGPRKTSTSTHASFAKRGDIPFLERQYDIGDEGLKASQGWSIYRGVYNTRDFDEPPPGEGSQHAARKRGRTQTLVH